MIDKYIYIIIALLPLTSLMLVSQVNPYQALVMRAIVGAIAALIYVILGAADVALTEALVGTMLAITLYLIAVRSSLVMRLGIVKQDASEPESYFTELVTNLKKALNKYPDHKSLKQALVSQEIHATCIEHQHSEPNSEAKYQTAIRVHRLFEIMQQELTAPETTLTYIPIANQEHQQ